MTLKELVSNLWTTTMIIAGLREVARASVKVDHFMQVQIVKEVVKLFETVVVQRITIRQWHWNSVSNVVPNMFKGGTM